MARATRCVAAVTTLLAHIASAKWPALNPAQPVRRMLPTLGTVRRRAAPRALEGTTHPAAKRSVDSQLLSIAGPALAGLCIDPLATLVDTVWASRLGTPELAALGAAGSLFALCAKTFNFVLPSTTSAVAAASSAAPGRDRGLQAGNATSFYIPAVIDVAYSSLLLALLIGVPVGLAMALGAPAILRSAAIGADSPVYAHALGYLRLRAPGAPFMLATMSLSGVFRGMRDTRTPLVALCVTTAVNMVLDPLFLKILPRSAAVAGLGAATAVAQAAGVVVLLAALRRRTPAGSAAAPRARLVRALASSASVMTARTFFGGLVYARASAGAAAASALAGAAHALTFNVWFNCALLADALAIAAQALLGAALPAAALRDSRADQAASAAASAAAMLEPTPRLIVARTARLAVGATVVLMVALMAGRDRVLALLTADPAVRAAAAVVWPVVVASQPACVLAFVADGLLFGARDFVGASLAMLGAAAPALLLLRGARPAGGAAAAELLRIWHTLALFMAVRATFALGWALRPGSPLLRDHTAIAYFDDDS